MEDLTIKGPKWFPTHLRKCVNVISLLSEIKKGGIYFIEYPKTYSEEIEGLLKNFFTLKQGKFIKYDDQEPLVGLFSSKLSEFIEKINFKTGPIKYSFAIEEKSEEEYEIKILRNSKEFSIENLSHNTIIQSIRVVHFLLQSSMNFLCFQMDTDILDKESRKIIYKIFHFLNEEIQTSDKNLIVFYSDEDLKFARDYLWRSGCYKQFAIIDEKTDEPYLVSNYEKSVENIKNALITENYKKIEMFLGAGASISSGLSSGKDMMINGLQELTDQDKYDEMDLLKEVGKIIDTDKYPIDLISLEVVMTLLQQYKEIDDLTQTKVLMEFAKSHQKALSNTSMGYNYLKELSSKISFFIVTTNFDELSEINLQNSNTIFDEEGFKNTKFGELVKNKNQNIVIKLHGNFSHPNTLGIQYQNIKKLPPYKKNFMMDYIHKSREKRRFTNVFFIGYNFGDPDVLDVLQDNIDKNLIRPIIINPRKSNSIIRYLDLFKDKPGRPTHIPYTFDYFMELLKKIINEECNS